MGLRKRKTKSMNDLIEGLTTTLQDHTEELKKFNKVFDLAVKGNTARQRKMIEIIEKIQKED